jgi:hypothetical protein
MQEVDSENPLKAINEQYVGLLEGAQGSISDDCAVMVGSLLPRGGMFLHFVAEYAFWRRTHRA